MVKNLERYNYENNVDESGFKSNNSYHSEQINKLNLTDSAKSKLHKIDYFYSRPYIKGKEQYNYIINFEVFYNPDNISQETLTKKLAKDMDVYLYKNDNNSQKRLNRTTMGYASHINIMSLASSTKWNQKNIDSLSIEIKDAGENLLVSIDKPYKTITYGYFNRRVQDRDQMSNNTVKFFLAYYYSDNKKDSESYIYDDNIANFKWSTLEKYERFSHSNYNLSYLGNFEDHSDVFIMSISDDTKVNTLDFYMLYQDLDWHIISVE